MRTKTPLQTKIKISNISLLIAGTMLVVMYLAGSSVYDRFGQISTVLNLFNDNAYLIVVAVGMTFVLLTGGIDISVASTLAFTGVFSASLLEKGLPAIAVIPLVLAIGTLVGYAQGYAIHTFQIAPFLVTLAGQFLMRGMCAVISTVSIPINDPFSKPPLWARSPGSCPPAAQQSSITMCMWPWRFCWSPGMSCGPPALGGRSTPWGAASRAPSTWA